MKRREIVFEKAFDRFYEEQMRAASGRRLERLQRVDYGEKMHCIIANFITKKIVLRIVTRIISNNKYTWDNVLLERRVFQKISHIVLIAALIGQNPLILLSGLLYIGEGK